MVVGAQVFAKEDKARALRRTLGMRKAAALDGRNLRTTEGDWSVLQAWARFYTELTRPLNLKRYINGNPDDETCPTLDVRPLFAFYGARF